MPLIDRSKMPPGGFPFREPTLNWSLPPSEQFIGFWHTVEAVQRVRAQNMNKGLDPSRAAVARAVDEYQCARLKGDERWCQAEESAEAKAEQARAVQATPRKKCGTCGGRKK